MSVLEADFHYQAGVFTLEVALHLDAPWTAVFGPSGCGKTSLLECVAGLRRPRRGRIAIGGMEAIGARTVFDTAAGSDVPTRLRRVGYVSQTLDLFPHLSVAENIHFSAGRQLSRAQRRAFLWDAVRSGRWVGLRAGRIFSRHASLSREGGARIWEDVVSILELTPLRGKRPAHLSGGERQRVALARALLSEPDLLLLDEPLTALDAPLRRRILAYLAEVKRRIAIPCLYVTHNPEEVLALADHVVFLEKGRVVGQGQPSQVLSSPTSAADLGLEVENVFVLPVVESDEQQGLTALELAPGQRLLIPYQAGARAGDRIRVGIRAGDCLLAIGAPGPTSARNVLPARVVEMVERGRDVYVRARLVAGEGADAADGQAISLWGCITPAALHQMGLTVAMDVTLLLKSHAVVVL